MMSKNPTNTFYLSGPMTGYEEYNFPRFHEAAAHLRKIGFQVFNPAESFEGRTDISWTTYMEHDFEAILDSAAVIVLEGWEKSLGSVLEVVVAVSAGKSVFKFTGAGNTKIMFRNTDDARNIVQDILNMYVAGSEPKTETSQNITNIVTIVNDGLYNEQLAKLMEVKPVWDDKQETILEEAQRLVHGDRGSAYGHPYDDFSRTAQIWSAILGIPVSAEQVSLCMVGLKISREVNEPKRDNRVDGAGYFETLDMVRQEADRRSRLSSKEESKIEQSLKLNKKKLKQSRKAKEDERQRRSSIKKFVDEAIIKYDLDNPAWDDYDDKGVPYWDKWTDENPDGIID